MRCERISRRRRGKAQRDPRPELRVLDSGEVAERLQKVRRRVEAFLRTSLGARPEEMNSRDDALVEQVVAVFAAALYRRELAAALREVLDDLSRVEFDAGTHKAICGRQFKVRRPRVPTELDGRRYQLHGVRL